MGSSSSTLDLAAGINSFGSSLFDELNSQANPSSSAGVFVSPYGIARALGMVLNGAERDGESYRQLQGAVFGAAAGDGLTLDALNSQLKQLSSALVKEPTDELAVSDANSAWLATQFKLQPAYAKALRDAFGAVAAPLTTSAAINAWVAEATRGKISGIVDDAGVAQSTLMLVNALYFKGLWEEPFNKLSTFPHTFHTLRHGSDTLQAATMFQVYKPGANIRTAVLSASLEGGGTLECPAVQLPYKGGEYYAVAAMPGGSFSDAAAQDGSQGLAIGSGATVPYSHALAACRRAVLSNLPTSVGSGAAAASLWVRRREDVKLYLPRFEVEFFANLSDSLIALGITQPFKGGDLTRIAADGSGGAVGDLFVSDVLHKVYAKVDEAGTEAAAATAVMMCRSAMPLPKPEYELRFDRPFVFAVVHGPSGLVLFCGEVHRPEEWSRQ